MLHNIKVIPNLFISFGNPFELITIVRLIIYIDERNTDFGECKQQRRRQTCISTQSDQHLFTCAFISMIS